MPRLAVAGERLPFALDPCQFGARLRQGACGLVPRSLERRLALPHRFESLARRSQPGSGAFGGLARVFDLALSIAARKRGALFGHAAYLGLDPVEPRAGLCDLSFDHAPFGLDPRQFRRRIGERQFGGAAGAFRILRAPDEGGALFFVVCQRLLVLGEVFREPRQRLGGIARQPVGLAPILFQTHLLPVEIGEALFGGFELAGERGHPVAVGAGIVAPVGQFLARR